MYSALIVDDEIHQQELLSKMLNENFPGLFRTEVCSSVDEGIRQVNILKPQLLFLDVVMPPKTGFDLLNAIKKIEFEIIFSTSYEHYAVNAFKVSAVDYLLKPFGVEDLRIAISRFEERLKLKKSLVHIETLLQNINSNTSEKTKIALPTLQGFVFVQIGDIVRCESDNVYTTFYFSDKSKMIISKSIKDCEELLADFNFFRVHASHLINLRFVKEYIKGDGGFVKMTDGSVADVSRRKKDDFLSALNKL